MIKKIKFKGKGEINEREKRVIKERKMNKI